HQPSGSDALHECADVGKNVGDQQIAENWSPERSPDAGEGFRILVRRGWLLIFHFLPLLSPLTNPHGVVHLVTDTMNLEGLPSRSRQNFILSPSFNHSSSFSCLFSSSLPA